MNLAAEISGKVSSPFGIKVNEQTWSAEIHSFLNLSHDNTLTRIEAYCVITVYDDWTRFMPDVKCREHWVRRDIDWHIGPDGTLCYDLDLRWRDVVNKVLKQEGIKAASIFAAEWCLHHSRDLLWRHYYAHVNNVESWPAEWPAWGHGEKGRKEYRLAKMRKHDI